IRYLYVTGVQTCALPISLATILVFLLAGIPLPARPAGTPNLLPLGVVTQASGAHFRAAKVSAGATIYDGDGLSTEAEGALQFREIGRASCRERIEIEDIR